MKPMGADRLKRMAKLPGARLDLAQDEPAPELPTPAPELPPAPAVEFPRELTVNAEELGRAVGQALQEALTKSVDPVNEAIRDGAQSQAKLLGQVASAIEAASEQPQRPRKWVFTVKRDLRGLIETIEAKAS